MLEKGDRRREKMAEDGVVTQKGDQGRKRKRVKRKHGDENIRRKRGDSFKVRAEFSEKQEKKGI